MRELLVTQPDRLKLAWRALRRWWHAAVLAWIDRYLAERDEGRVPLPLDFEELAVLYDETDIPVLFDEAAGFTGNSLPETPATVDYGDLHVL